MTDQEKLRASARAKVLKALAHPSRIFIIDKLAEKAYCVCELTDMIGADTSTVSKHLSVLKNAGLVADSKQGTSIYYSLTCPCIMKFIGCIESVIENSVKSQLACIKP